MELQAVQGNPGWKPVADAPGEINDQVFAGRLIVDDVLFFKHLRDVCHVPVDSCLIQDHSMIKGVDDFVVDKLFEVAEVDDHAVFGMMNIPGRGAGDGDKQTV